ncbi:DNA-binding protein [Rheinheimera faecalis]
MAELTHVPTFSGDAFCGVYLGFRTEERTRQDNNEKYTVHLLGMQIEIPHKFGGTQEMIIELTVSKALHEKGFLTLMADYTDQLVALPVYITSYGKNSVTRYVTESALQIFSQGAKVQKEQAA